MVPKPRVWWTAAPHPRGEKTAGLVYSSHLPMENQLIAVIVRFPSALQTTESRDPGGHLSVYQGFLYHQEATFLHRAWKKQTTSKLLLHRGVTFTLRRSFCSILFLNICWPEMALGVIHLLIFHLNRINWLCIELPFLMDPDVAHPRHQSNQTVRNREEGGGRSEEGSLSPLAAGQLFS